MEEPTLEDPSDSPGEEDARAMTLLVDDIEGLRRLYGKVLERGGPFEIVAEAGDGSEAISAAREHQPDLVLLDLSMPGMDGLEALPRILETSPESTVVVLSGFLEERVGEQARELGAAAYLEKGEDPGQLVQRLVEVLDWGWSGPSEDGFGAEPKTTPSDVELEQFAYTASHDLQEPLRMVASYLDLFQDRYATEIDQEGIEMLGYAAEGVDRMQAMVDGLLTYSRLTTRRGDPEPVDLGDVLEDALANLTLRVQGANAEVTYDAMPTVPADRGQILQLFQNLLENAVKFNGGEARVHIGARDLGDTVEVTVEDDGPGIPEEELGRIFSLFQRGTRAQKTEGSGLGLSICKRIVERHGGSISVSSTDGDGTTFTIELPKRPHDDPEGAP